MRSTQMVSTTEELTAQASQLMSALGFFPTEDGGQASHAPASRPTGASLRKVQAVLGRSVAPSFKKTTKSGVAFKLQEITDTHDKEFERF